MSLTSSIRSRAHTAFVFATIALLSLTACNGDSTSPAKATSIEQETWASILNVDLTKFTKLPSGVYIQDVVVGTGDAVPVGAQVTVNYEGRLANGSLFDAGTLNFFALTSAIQGWQVGIPGMKIGGTRKLLIPAALGYGSSNYGTIPGNSNLWFQVTLNGFK